LKDKTLNDKTLPMTCISQTQPTHTAILSFLMQNFFRWSVAERPRTSPVR